MREIATLRRRRHREDRMEMLSLADRGACRRVRIGGTTLADRVRESRVEERAEGTRAGRERVEVVDRGSARQAVEGPWCRGKKGDLRAEEKEERQRTRLRDGRKRRRGNHYEHTLVADRREGGRSFEGGFGERRERERRRSCWVRERSKEGGEVR
jgi:hypothetical protein